MAQHLQLLPKRGEVRTLPLRCTPAAGESFGSYLDRLSALYETPLATILSSVGLVSAPGDPVIPGWGVAMSDEQFNDFATATRLPSESVSAMLLKAFDGTFLDLTDVDPGRAMTVRRAAVREWARVNGSRFCPHCLSETPQAWLMRWKLNWSFACAKHGALLRDVCQACERPAGSGRADMTATPAYLGKVVNLACCRNVPPNVMATRGVDSLPCGAPLWTQAAVMLPERGRAIAAQLAIDSRIDRATRGDISSGEANAIRAFARETRSLAALILLTGEADSFCVEVDAMRSAVEAHLEARARLMKVRHQAGKAAPRLRVFTKSGASSALTAAALVPAVEITVIDDTTSLVDALIPLAKGMKGATNITKRQLIDDFQFSERLAHAFLKATAATSSFGRITKVYPCEPDRFASRQFGPRHVPQLVPEAIYDARFRDMLPGVTPMAGRRFVAMAAVKSFGCTWEDAAMQLDLPPEAAGYSKKAVPLINGQGLERRFLNEVAAWLDELRGGTPVVDYSRRRRLLRSLDDVPPRMWSATCSEAGILKGEKGRRSRYAAAWLWAELTQGDWRLSPAMQVLADEPNAREIYQRQVNRMAGALQILKGHAAKLLRAEQVRASTMETALDEGIGEEATHEAE